MKWINWQHYFSVLLTYLSFFTAYASTRLFVVLGLAEARQYLLDRASLVLTSLDHARFAKTTYSAPPLVDERTSTNRVDTWPCSGGTASIAVVSRQESGLSWGARPILFSNTLVMLAMTTSFALVVRLLFKLFQLIFIVKGFCDIFAWIFSRLNSAFLFTFRWPLFFSA